MALLMRARIFRCFTNYRIGPIRNILTGQLRVTTACAQRNCIVDHTPRDKNLALYCTAAKLKEETNLDRHLHRLDQNVKRIGRISRQELEEVITELRQSDAATSTQSLLIIRCCGNLIAEEAPDVRTKLVQDIWEILSSQGVTMDISHYNALLMVYLENDYNFSPTEFLEELERKRVEPNRVTFQRLIARYCQDGDIEGATSILEYMNSEKMPVNDCVFNALILGYSQADDMESATGMLNVMQKAGLQPTADTYSTLLCCHARRGDIDGIRSLIETCNKQNVNIVDKNYLDVIYTLCMFDHQEHIDEIIQQLVKTAGYNQEAISLILRLIRKGHIDVAKKIFYTMPPRRDAPSGSFFIRQLVMSDAPVEALVSVCTEFEESKLNLHCFDIALGVSVREGKVNTSYALLSAMKNNGKFLRPHYFWPIMAVFNRAGDHRGLLDVLERMSRIYNIRHGGTTMRDYVVPFMYDLGSEEKHRGPWVVSQLQSAGVPIGISASALVCHLLTLNNIQEAARIAKRYRAVYSPSYLRKQLVQAYANTSDAKAFVELLKRIYDTVSYLSYPTSSSSSSSSDDTIVDRTEIVGQFLIDIVRGNFKDKSALLLGALKELVQQKLPLTSSAAEHLREALSNNDCTEISQLLERLTSGEFVNIEPRPVGLTAVRLRKDISQLLAQKEAAGPLKLQLLLYYCRKQDLERVDANLKRLKAQEIPLTAGVGAQVIDFYTKHKQLDAALSVLNEMPPDFRLDENKVVKLATLMVASNKFEDAVQLLKQHEPPTKSEGMPYLRASTCRELLSTLADQGEVNALEQMYDVLLSSNYIEVSNVLLGPLIKVHIIRNDLDGALKKFEECCTRFHCTPWKNELACRLIKAGDAAALQRLTDLSTLVHGEVNSLYDLVFSFVECDRMRQARKILETPGLQSRPERVNAACQRFILEGKIDALNGLLKVTKDLIHIDQLSIYQHLLDTYCKSNDPEKALGLWTQMQEDDIQPSDEFLAKLGNFLRISGVSVPFAVPNLPIPVEKREVQEETSTALNEFSSSIREDLPKAVNMFLSMCASEKKQILSSELSTFLENLLTSNLEDSAQKIFNDMMKLEIYPSYRGINSVVKYFAKAGNVEFISSLNESLPEYMKKPVQYNRNLMHAHLVSARAPQYLYKLEEELDLAEDQDIPLFANRLPHSSSVTLLRKHPELFPQYVKIAEKFARHGVVSPMNSLWIYYILVHKYELADEIWNEYLVNSPQLLFKQATLEAKLKEDYKMIKYVLDKVRNSAVKSNSIGYVYSCAINILSNLGKTSEAEQLAQEAKNEVGVHVLDKKVLVKLHLSLTREEKVLNLPEEVQEECVSTQTSTKPSNT